MKLIRQSLFLFLALSILFAWSPYNVSAETTNDLPAATIENGALPIVEQATDIQRQKKEMLIAQEREGGGVDMLKEDIYTKTMDGTAFAFRVVIIPTIVLFFYGAGLLLYRVNKRGSTRKPKALLFASFAIIGVPIVLNVAAKIMIEFNMN